MHLIIEGASLRDARQAWQAAQYARFAYHQPDDMPEMPGNARRVERTRQVDLVEAKAWMRAVSNRKDANGC